MVGVLAAPLVSEVEDFSGFVAGFGESGEVGEGDALVLLQSGEAEVLGAEEEQRVEQHDGRVGAQLLTLPQVGLHHPGGDCSTWRRTVEGAGFVQNKHEQIQSLVVFTVQQDFTKLSSAYFSDNLIQAFDEYNP